MTNTQLKGQVFNRDGVNYLVLDDNDFSADSLRVKTIDASRAVTEMNLDAIIESVFGGNDVADPA